MTHERVNTLDKCRRCKQMEQNDEYNENKKKFPKSTRPCEFRSAHFSKSSNAVNRAIKAAVNKVVSCQCRCGMQPQSRSANVPWQAADSESKCARKRQSNK